jgi:hypothetical protein
MRGENLRCGPKQSSDLRWAAPGLKVISPPSTSDNGEEPVSLLIQMAEPAKSQQNNWQRNRQRKSSPTSRPQLRT